MGFEDVEKPTSALRQVEERRRLNHPRVLLRRSIVISRIVRKLAKEGRRLVEDSLTREGPEGCNASVRSP